MNMAFTAGCLFILQCIFSMGISGPVLTASPDEINLGFTDTLDVNCTLSLAEWPGVAALISLSVSANKSVQNIDSDLGIISGLLFNGEAKVITTDDQVTANGHFNSRGSAFISLHWNNPTYQQDGLYTCKAVGLDPSGNIVEEIAQIQVYARSPALSDWQDKVIQMDLQLKEMQNFITTQEAKDQQRIEEMQDFITSQETKCQERIEAKEQRRMSTIINMFSEPIHHNNHSYYLYKFLYTTTDLAQATCMIIGGYLAEINDQAELSVIQKYLKALSGFNGAVIAGTDEGHEGRWTLPSGDPLPFTYWYATNRGTTRNCIVLWESEFRMHDFFCGQAPDWRVRFMCEVPQV